MLRPLFCPASAPDRRSCSKRRRKGWGKRGGDATGDSSLVHYVADAARCSKTWPKRRWRRAVAAGLNVRGPSRSPCAPLRRGVGQGGGNRAAIGSAQPPRRCNLIADLPHNEFGDSSSVHAVCGGDRETCEKRPLRQRPRSGDALPAESRRRDADHAGWSVIIPSYNRRNRGQVLAALEVASGGRDSLEVLVVDDGSHRCHGSGRDRLPARLVADLTT